MYESFARGLRKMRIAILYTTIGGTTRECAELLKRELTNQSVELFDVSEREPHLADFDAVVLGFPIIMGKAAKPMRKYIKLHKDELKDARAAYYICCGFVDCFEDYVKRTIPDELRESAIDATCLGGSLDPTRFKGINKMIVKSVRADILGGGDNGDERRDMSLPTIFEENISQLADKIKKSAE